VIQIKHKDTNEVLRDVLAYTLVNVDLYGANLAGADLRYANLSGAILREANLPGAVLSDADLLAADLRYANLRGATLARAHLAGALLSGAGLRGADLSGADLKGANLFGADLTGANLVGTNLTGVELTDADLTEAILDETGFSRCPSLQAARGMAHVLHIGPSYLDRSTLMAGISSLPDGFLEGTGYTPEEISNLRTLYAARTTAGGPRFASCYIVAPDQKQDQIFVNRLCGDLRSRNVSCWPLRDRLKRRSPRSTQAEGLIRGDDRRIVVCSGTGIFREEVIREIVQGMEDERREGIPLVFLVRLDDSILSKNAKAQFASLPPSQRPTDWLSVLKSRAANDFTGWKNHTSYEKRLGELVEALQNSTPL